MTGLIGGTVDDPELEVMAASMHQEDWYELSRTGDRDASVGVLEHGNRDADANVVWQGDGAVGVVYGVVSNRDRLSLSWDELFDGVRDPSTDLLPRLEGPFALACVDTRAETVHLATDKAGSRPVYYAAEGGFQFASEVAPLLDFVDDPSLDERAVGDLLAFGAVIGDRTLVDAVGSLPPATRLVFDGEVTTERYWYPETAGIAPAGYPDHWLGTYRSAIGDVATTASDLSLWLSGGIDSRVAAGTLADAEYPFETLTCGTSVTGDREPAAQVAAYLGVPNRQVGPGPQDDVVDAVRTAVSTTDGAVNWATVDALPFMTGGLHGAAEVVMAGGNFLGENAWAARLHESDSAVDALAENARTASAERGLALLDADVDPLESVREAVAASVDGPPERTALDAARRMDACTNLRSNAVERSQVGTRTVTHGSMIDTAVRMPARYRMGTLPLDGPLPAGTAPIKRAVVRRLDANLAEIPTGGSRVPRAVSGSADGANGTGTATSRPQDACGVYARLYHADDRLQTFVDDLLLDARERAVFDADAVTELHSSLVAGDRGAFAPVAAVTGVESWAQANLGSAVRDRLAPTA